MQEAELECRGVRLSLKDASVTFQGKRQELTKTELKLLHYLFSRQGEIVSREEIIDALWDQHVFLDDNGLSVNITRTVSYTHLNQLLAEMDGFDTSKGLLILAATNRPEVLDPALLRPGRFDRRVIVDRPDLKGRVEILKVHAKDVLLDETVDLDAIALATSGAVEMCIRDRSETDRSY